MSELLFKLDGVGGQLELYKDKIIIRRKGMIAKMNHGLKGDKSIYLSQISGIQVKPAGALTNGYIQFTISGGKESRGGLMSATKDENTVMFAKKDNGLVEKIREKIEELRFVSSQPVAIQNSAADEIRKFKQLLDEGIISQEDFDKKKKELIG